MWEQYFSKFNKADPATFNILGQKKYTRLSLLLVIKIKRLLTIKIATVTLAMRYSDAYEEKKHWKSCKL